jgi:WD40 repeat protein
MLQKYVKTDLVSNNTLFDCPAKSLDVSNEVNEIVIVSKKGEIKVLDLDLNVIATGTTDHAECVAWNPTGGCFALGTFSGKLSICKKGSSSSYIPHGLKRQELDSLSISLHELEVAHTDAISGIYWDSIETLISSSLDHNIFITDLETSQISSSVLCPRVNLI